MDISFPQGFVAALVYGAVAFTALGALTMLALLIRDYREGRLW